VTQRDGEWERGEKNAIKGKGGKSLSRGSERKEDTEWNPVAQERKNRYSAYNSGKPIRKKKDGGERHNPSGEGGKD